MIDLIKKYNIPSCSIVHGATFSEDFQRKTKESQDIEGFVIRFEDGHMVKIKSDWYVALHRVKSEIAYERGVVKLLLTDSMDDLKPLMPEEDLVEIDEYEKSFMTAYYAAIEEIHQTLITIVENNISRKDFALGLAKELEGYQTQIIFKLFDEECSKENIANLLKCVILNQTGKNVKFDTLRKTKLFENVKSWRGVYIDA